MFLGKGGWKRLEKKARPWWIVLTVMTLTGYGVYWGLYDHPEKDYGAPTTITYAAARGCGDRGACCPNDSYRVYLDESSDDTMDSISYDIPNQAYWCFSDGRMVPAVLPSRFDPSKDFRFYWTVYWVSSDLDTYWPLQANQ